MRRKTELKEHESHQNKSNNSINILFWQTIKLMTNLTRETLRETTCKRLSSGTQNRAILPGMTTKETTISTPRPRCLPRPGGNLLPPEDVTPDVRDVFSRTFLDENPFLDTKLRRAQDSLDQDRTFPPTLLPLRHCDECFTTSQARARVLGSALWRRGICVWNRSQCLSQGVCSPNRQRRQCPVPCRR